MPNSPDLQRVVRDLGVLVSDTASESTFEDAEVRRVLAFVSQVIIVVEQAFQDVLTVLIEIKFIKNGPQHHEAIDELRRRIELLTARSYYRDAAEICSRLKHLRENYDTFIRSSVQKLPRHSDWQGVFGLIEEREGRIIQLVESTANELSRLLDDAHTGNLAQARQYATQSADELRLMLSELQTLNCKILGLSGSTGFLEMTKDRNSLEREVRVYVDQRDQSVTHGHRLDIGDGNTFHGDVVVATTIQDSFKSAAEAPSHDLRQKLEELCSQVEAMVKGLPKEKALEVSQDLSNFVKEAGKPEPRRKWYELSADGLIEAAKACAGMTSPIIATVKQIVALLA